VSALRPRGGPERHARVRRDSARPHRHRRAPGRAGDRHPSCVHIRLRDHRVPAEVPHHALHRGVRGLPRGARRDRAARAGRRADRLAARAHSGLGPSRANLNLPHHRTAELGPVLAQSPNANSQGRDCPMYLLSRLRLAGFGALICMLLLLPAAAQAKRHSSPNGRHNISITVSDNPAVAGDQLVIFGRLKGPNNGHRVVTLWHRINPRPRFTPVQRTTTDSQGFYAFFRQRGVVNTNRNWYVRSLRARSRTVHERVFSLVTLSGPADGSNLQTGPAHKVTFTGTVSPFRVGDRVILQRQNADNGNRWHRIDRTRVRPGGSYTFNHTFRVPGDANIRVLVQSTRRNIASVSNVLGYEISQAQNPALTLTSSADPVTIGQSTTLSGTLQGGGGQTVNLFAKTKGGQFQQVATTTADSSGNYSFVQVPLHNTLYQAQGGGKKSAQLFEG